MNLTNFNFESSNIRIFVDESNEPWFVASDVCKVLCISHTASATRNLDDDEKGVRTIHTLGGSQQMTTVNESGLYSLIMTSRKDEAKRFKKWVTSEVLPSIRKTGRYSIKQETSTPAVAELAFWDAVSKSLNIAPSAHLGGVRKIAISHGHTSILEYIPNYAVDAPSDTLGTSSEVTKSATVLLKEHNYCVSTKRFNEQAEKAGILVKNKRKSRSIETGFKEFWSFTNNGMKYGKNVTNPTNQLETQPHWYVSKFGDALKEILESNIGFMLK
jgi:prophage antirepressor-like protein